MDKTLISMLTIRERDLFSNACDLIQDINPLPVLEALDNIPDESASLVTFNLYSHCDFMVFWAVAALVSALLQTPSWLMTSAWTNHTSSLDQLRTGLTRTSILCFASEGGDFSEGNLGNPRDGTGKFILHALMHLKRILPVGINEESGHPYLNFGSPYTLEVKHFRFNDKKQITTRVLKEIAALLPTRTLFER